MIPGLAASTGLTPGDTEIEVGKLPERMERLEIDDTDDLPALLNQLRSDGKLLPQGLIFFEIDGSTRAPVFLNLLPEGGTGFPAPPKDLPLPFPLRRTILLSLEQLHTFGGLFIEFPRGARLRRLARLAGLADLYEAVTSMLAELDGVDFKEKSEKLGRELKTVTTQSVKQLMQKPPLRLRLPPPSEPP
ncbi:MAG: hypothetical protein L3J97_00580 [Thermoplasmata archaeon]|nr:hypothetical protein [Thermoplasmata archaeon]